MERLQNKDAWLSFIFQDGSRMTIHTTCSASYLKKVGAELRLNMFYDLERMRYVPFPEEAVEVEIYDDKPVYKSEVLNFASRFI